jgi:chorismate dehydratase
MFRVSLVSYSNTLPFRYSLENSQFSKNYVDLEFCYPSKCFELIKNKNSQVSLVPVGALIELEDFRIFSDYCIAAKNKVESVLLLSQKPINELNTILLDYQSKTSVLLIKILNQFMWKRDLNFLHTQNGYEQNIVNETGGVVIGDRAMKIRKNYKYAIDLAQEWYNLTGLPAVFAVWVALNSVPQTLIENLNKIFKNGIDNLSQVVKFYQKHYPYIDLNYYYSECVDFKFDYAKNRSLNLFLDYVKRLENY